MASIKLCRLPRPLKRDDLVRRLPLQHFRDRTGEVVDGCTVLGLAGFISDRFTTWLCRCHCGKQFLATTGNLQACRVGCGCGRIKHGMTHLPIYSQWLRLKNICYNADHPSFRHFGGQGVTMCRRWRSSLEAFAEDVGPKPKGKYTLELINRKLGFRPGNVRWVSRRRYELPRWAKTIEFEGERLNLQEWAERLGTTHQTLRQRIANCQRMGADVTEALATPIGQQMPCMVGRVKWGRKAKERD